MLRVSRRSKQAVLWLFFLSASSSAMGQVELGVRSASGPPGSTVEIEIYYLGNGIARSYQFDVTTDLSLIEGGEAGVDLSRCLESAPSQSFESCTVLPPPDSASVRVGQVSFFSPIPDIDPIGVIGYTISAEATPGTTIPLDITDFSVEAVDPENVGIINGQILVLPPAGAILNVMPASIDFDSQPVGTTSDPEVATISNTGPDGSGLTVEGISVAGEFGLVGGGSCPPLPFVLSGGQSCTQLVDFSPSAAGPASGSLLVTSDSGDDTVELTGQGAQAGGGAIELGVRSASGIPGQTVDVEIFYRGNGVARSYQFDVTSDLNLIQGIDTSRCLESAPSQTIENCVVRPPPNDASVRVGQVNFFDPIPDIDPIGVISYTISETATPGTLISLDVTDFAVENVEPEDVTAVNGEILVLTPAVAVLELSPEAIDFGSQRVGTRSAPELVTISNGGTSGVDMMVSSLSLEGDFVPAAGGSCPALPFVLSDGESCTQLIEFLPISSGAIEGSLSVGSDAGAIANDSAALTGRGTVELGVKPAEGPPGATVEVELYFLGDAQARTYQFDVTTDLDRIQGIDVSRCLENAPSQTIENCVVRPPPDEATVRVGQANFVKPIPDIDPIGVVSYTISSSALPNTTIPLDITDFSVEGVEPEDIDGVSAEISVLPPAVLDVGPVSIDFGPQQEGTTSAPQSVTIENEGTGGVDLTVSGIIVDGDFTTIEGGSCPILPFALSDGESCTQWVGFSPVSPGPLAGLLSVVSDAGEIGNDAVALTGEGTAAPVQLAIVQSPRYGVVNGPIFDGVVVHVLDTQGELFADDSTTVVQIDLANDPSGMGTLAGTTTLEVTNGVAVFSDLSIDAAGNGFVLRASDQSQTLAPGESEAFNIRPDGILRDRFEN